MSSMKQYAKLGESLAPRQREALQGLANGLNRKKIAQELGISLHTLHGHIEVSFIRLGARSVEHAVALALRQGLIT